MKNAEISLIIIVGLAVIVSGCIQEQQIGGERDEHGCLVPAGYSWSETIGACLRNWELNESQARAAKIAADYLVYDYGMSIVQVITEQCPGCFKVEIEKGGNIITVEIVDWEVIGKTLTSEECLAKGGRTVKVVGDSGCYENETEIGSVTGFTSSNICCLPLEKACTDSGGTVASGMCCLSATDFPNSCLIGACGCGPDSSHEVDVCECGEGKCFDGRECILLINSFDDCARAGYPVMESYPRQCSTPDGRSFVEVLDECTGVNGSVMSLAEALSIVLTSPCTEDGAMPEETYSCNSYTGTWWIDLDIDREGCSPACVVDIEDRSAEINWRCTGLLA